MRKLIKKSFVAMMTAAMVISSVGVVGTKAEAATSGYILQNHSAQDLMKEYGVIAFNNGVIKVHFHSNFLVNNLNMNSNSGLRTTYNTKEAFYFKTAENVSANMSEYSAANTDVLYTGTTVQKTNGENRVKLTNGSFVKIDRPTTIISDSEIEAQGTYTQYVDILDVKNKFVAYNKALATQANKGSVQVSITSDMNNRYIQVGSGENYCNIAYDDFAKYASNQISFDFSDYNNNDTLVINIDLKGQTAVSFPALILRQNGTAISNNEDNFNKKYNRVYYNFYDSSKADKQYTGKITFSGRGFGTIIAPSASVELSQNWDGSVVANNVEVAGQFHRINGTAIPTVSISNGTPGTDTPGTDTSGTNTPGTNTPGTNTSGGNTSGDNTSSSDKTDSSSSENTGDLSITIKDEKTDDPVPGVTVEVTSPDGDKKEYVTDKNGTVEIKDVPEGDYTVVVTDVPSGYNVTEGSEVEVTVKKGKKTKKTVTKKAKSTKNTTNAKDAKNANKALQKAADIKTGDADLTQLLDVQETQVTQLGAKNNKKITKKYNKKLKAYKKKYKKQSSEISAWITIAGTKIDYPVMYTGLKNNTKYLQKNIDGEKDPHGMLFASYITPKRKITYNNVIYGHNMKDGTMFTDLTKYANKAFYKKHKYVKLDTQKYNYVYEVVEVIRISCKKGSKDRMIYEKFAQIDNKKVFKKWQKQVAKNREYKCSGKYKRTDNLLMLSTCEYEKENGRFVLICKQVKCKKVK